METSTHGRLSKYEVAGLVSVAFIGLLHLFYRFDGDQALFTEGASRDYYPHLMSRRDFKGLASVCKIVFSLETKKFLI